MSANERRETAVRELAYKLWELAGRPQSMDLDLWLEAERRVDRYRRFWVEE